MRAFKGFFLLTGKIPVVLALALIIHFQIYSEADIAKWEILEAGLKFREFKARKFFSPGDSIISVLQIDTNYFVFKYLGAAELDSVSKTPAQWADEYNLTAAINAGMYHKDYLTHVGFLKNNGKIYSRAKPRNYKSVLVFNPVNSAQPGIRLLDLECSPFEQFEKTYHTIIQNIRMISCRGLNVWARRDEYHSIAALGQDSSGNILFIFSASPFITHDFIEIIKKSDLSVKLAMYLEGGSPAGMFIRAGKRQIEKRGVPYGTETLFKDARLKLPNVIGVTRK